MLVFKDPVPSKSDVREAWQEERQCAAGRKHDALSRQVTDEVTLVIRMAQKEYEYLIPRRLSLKPRIFLRSQKERRQRRPRT